MAKFRTIGLLLLCLAAYKPANAQQFAQPGNFDFYVFTLSWSPQFCASTQNQKAECHVPGNSFVVHGLWPQFKSGSWPANCSGVPGPADPSKEANIMGDPTLVEHEWKTHGTCSGLSVDGYFALIKTVRQSIVIPDAFVHQIQNAQLSPSAIKTRFLAANPQLTSSEIAVGCANNALVQVQVCLAKDGTGIACSGIKDCHAPLVNVLPILQ